MTASKWNIVIVVFGIAIAIALCQPAQAQERVAQLTTVSGSVTVTRAADGAVDTAQQVGPRVRNGSVFPGDVVATEAGASAKLVFSDGTELRLEEGTALTIQPLDVSTLLAQGERQQVVGRRIKVLAGKVFAEVVPGGAVATEFETPSGVAAVKGTTLSIEVRAEEPK